MERLRSFWKRSVEQPYEPIAESPSEREGNEDIIETDAAQSAFSYIDYAIFLLLGISMLWAWNMMLAAGPYFQMRFQDDPWIFDNFQASEISVATVANLGMMLVLTKLQSNASYPKRIITSLCINTIVFALLAGSTSFKASAGGYFGFLMVMILSTSLATGLCQNGIFSFVSGFEQPSYTQGIMTGQAVAGVLPCIIQIVSVLSVPAEEQRPDQPSDGKTPGEAPPVRPSAALAYFCTATGIAIITLLAFLLLLARHRRSPKTHDNTTDELPDDSDERKSIPLRLLFSKLSWLATAVFLTFAITMVFPIYTQRIISVRPPQDQPAYLQPPSFIPLAFLFWNSGDLIGRLITAIPALSLVRWPRVLLALAASRIVFVGLYHLCNIRGQGAVISSDFFYLVIVQFLFGISNGYLGSTCMIGANSWVKPEEREAAGGFMGLCLVGGLAVGSLSSFFVAGA